MKRSSRKALWAGESEKNQRGDNPVTMEILPSGESYLHLALVGKMDVVAAKAVEKELLSALAAGGKSAIIDCSGITFVGSMGLRVFLLAVKELKAIGKELVLLKPQPMVREVFDASGIEDVLSVTDDPAQAVELAS